MEKFTTKRTSPHSAEVVEPFILDENKLTRRIFNAVLNDSKRATGETASGEIVHQRKGKNDTWENFPTFKQTQVKAGEEIKMILNSQQVKNLYDALSQLYSASSEGIESGVTEFVAAKSSEVIVVQENKKEIIDQLIQQDFGVDIWEELTKANPDLATQLSFARIQQERLQALLEFQNSMDEDLSEEYWQKFFSKNEWIFGYGLNYQYLNMITDQPHYGGTNVEGRGNQKGDFLLNTEADAKFTVLVEIKKPSTNIISRRTNGDAIKYRNGAMLLSGELLGGTSQIQVNSNKWTFTSQTPDKKLEGYKTIKPKGILIIGHTRELKDDESIETFEVYRQSLSHPKILTFDELYERAKFIIHNGETEVAVEKVAAEEDILPF